MVLFGLSILGITLFYLFYRSLDSNQKQTLADIFDDFGKSDDSAHTYADNDDSSHHAADFDDSSYSCDDGGDDGGDGGD